VIVMIGRGKWLAGILALAALVFIVGCTREVVVVATPTPGPDSPAGLSTPGVTESQGSTPQATPSPATAEATGPRVYQLGIFEDLSTTNYWAYLGPDTTIWNHYVLAGGKPTLFGYSDKSYNWVPSLAADFPTDLKEEVVDGQTLWASEVELKQGIMWSDGKEITAEDFVFTAHTVRDLQLTANWASIVPAEYFHHAEAVSPYKLKVFFKKQPGLAVWQFGLAFMPILSKAYWEPVVEEAKKQGDIAAQQKVLYAHVPENEPTAGGFSFSKWEKGAFVEKVKNPDYSFSGTTITEYVNGAYVESKPGLYDFSAYGEPAGEKAVEYKVGPYVDSTIYSIYNSQDAAVLALKKGDIDFMLNPIGLQQGLQEQLEGEPGLTTIENPSDGVRYLGFNLRKPPMDNKAFRQAVATLIDKEFIASTVLQGVAIPVYSMVPEGNTFWYNPDVPKIGLGLTRGERVAQAVELLKGAGFTWETEPKASEDGTFVEQQGRGLKMPNGEPMPELEILAPSAGYDPLRSTFAIWTERWLNEVGIPARANLTGFNLISDKVFEQQEFDMWIFGWSLPLFPDYLEAFFHSRNSDLSEHNAGGYSNPEFDRLADELLAETDLEEAQQKVFEMQEFLAEDLPYVVLFTTPILEAYRSDRLEFPYTETLGGLQNAAGLTTTVHMK
jgi:peptide/nickel transport system substrate-binding protein